MKKYAIIRYMTGWAIKRRKFFVSWEFIRYGHYWPSTGLDKTGWIMEFSTKESAEEFLIKSLWVKKEQIV